MSPSKYLITAPTGATGGATVSNLLKLSHHVRALAHREDDRSRALRDLGVEVVYGDLNDFHSVKNALEGIEGAYFCYPIAKGPVQASAQFGQAAKENGVRSIVNMSQKIAREDASSHASFEHWLSERVLDWTGLSITHLRPPFFAEWMFALSPMIRRGQVFAPFANGKTAFIAAEDQGRVIAKILADFEPYKGKTYYLCGPKELSFQEAVEQAGRALSKFISYQVVPFSVMMENIAANSVKTGRNTALNGYAESNQPDGLSVPHIFQHLREAHQDFENGLFSGMNNDVENITGTPPMSIETFITKHRAAFV